MALGYFSAREWVNMDIGIIFLGQQEPLGVYAVEIQAYGTVVIISNIPRLIEATRPGKSSYAVRRSIVEDLVKVIILFYEDVEMRLSVGILLKNYMKSIVGLARLKNNLRSTDD